MPWRGPCTPYFEGRAVGNSPLGGCRGDEEDARGVTAIRQVAGAHLAYRLVYLLIHFKKNQMTWFLSFSILIRVYSPISFFIRSKSSFVISPRA